MAPGAVSTDMARPGLADLGTCAIRRLGIRPYGPMWDVQRDLARARRDGAVGDTLLLLEHPHTITLGRRGQHEHILVDAAARTALGIEVHETDRGGDVTYHGPGQLVGYPILKLDRWRRDIRQYMRNLEEVLIRAISTFGVRGRRIEGLTGVWVGDEKIAAIGVRVAYWVTTHGFALNVNPDLGFFERIVPCGIADRGVTSLARLLGHAPRMPLVEDAVIDSFACVFDLEMHELVAGEQAI